MTARDDLIDRLIEERYRPMPPPLAERTDLVHQLDPSDTEAACAKRRADLAEAVKGFIYTPEPERKRAKITNHLRTVRSKAA